MFKTHDWACIRKEVQPGSQIPTCGRQLQFTLIWPSLSSPPSSSSSRPASWAACFDILFSATTQSAPLPPLAELFSISYVQRQSSLLFLFFHLCFFAYLFFFAILTCFYLLLGMISCLEFLSSWSEFANVYIMWTLFTCFAIGMFLIWTKSAALIRTWIYLAMIYSKLPDWAAT